MTISKKTLFFMGLFIFVVLAYFTHMPQPQTIQPEIIRPMVLPSPVASAIPQGAQMVKSVLGLDVKFLDGRVDYPGLMLINDPRYQALAPHEKLVDAIRFQPLQGPPYLLLVAIAKDANGSPLIVPGKFIMVHKTPLEGHILKDAQGRTYYYSGYLMMTPAWTNLLGGQQLDDRFCKEFVPMEMCPAQRTVNVVLKKSGNPSRDVPFLVLVQ